MSTHSFDIEDAQKYGINAAVILYNLRFWLQKNAANGKHYHDGEYWTYNSVRAFQDLFPYMSSKQIKTALKKLEEFGVIKTGNYNTSAYDRTTWYCIVGFGNVDCTKMSNGSTEKGQPIPDSKPDNKLDILPPIVPQGGDHDPIDHAFDLWNEVARDLNLPLCQAKDSRKSNMRNRLKDAGGIEGWKIALGKVRKSRYLRGEKTDFRCTIDFMLQKRGFAKIMEGNYDDNTNQHANAGNRGSILSAHDKAMELAERGVTLSVF